MLSTLALLSNLVLANGAYAQVGSQGLFGFFDGRDIDYWGEGRQVKDGLKLEAAMPHGDAAPYSGATVVRAGDSQPFSWDAYQSPQSPEFWDDGGDWIPPRPFREAVAAPNSENIAKYLAWQGRKAEVLGTFQAALNQRAAVLLPKEPQKPAAAAPVLGVPWSEVKIAYFYQTSCPHCLESRESIEAARRLGAQVTFIQLDHQSSPPMHTPSVPYSQEWAETFHVAATPTWILSWRGKTLKHTGALNLSELGQMTSHLTTLENQHE